MRKLLHGLELKSYIDCNFFITYKDFTVFFMPVFLTCRHIRYRFESRKKEQGSHKVNCKVIAIENQKGGTGKSTKAFKLSGYFNMNGKKVWLIDADPWGSLSISIGIKRLDELDVSLATLMSKVINDK